MVQLLYQDFFFLAELVRILRVDGREVACGHFVFLAINLYGSLFVVYVLKESSAVHFPFWMLGDELTFYLELYHGNSLVHQRCESLGLVIHSGCTTCHLWQEFFARIITVGIHRKGCQWNEVDAVTLLQGGEVGIAQRQSDDVADTGIITGCGSHPEYVVVAPLNIPAMIVAHLVENDVCSWSAIVYVAEYMKLVDGESLYHIGNGYDEIVSTSCRDDGIYDDIYVCCLVVIFRMLVQKLLYDIGEIAWQ